MIGLIKNSLILVCCFILVFPLVAQTTYNCEISSPTQLRYVLDDIAENYNIQFAFPTELGKETKITANNITANSINELLETLLEKTSVEYLEMESGKVLLRKSKTTPLPASQWIRGKVHDQFGLPLTHGAIYLEDVTLGTFVDDQGEFKLKVPTPKLNQNLIISFLGYEEKIIALSDFQQDIVWVMEEQVVEIESVVISHSIPRLQVNLSDHSLNFNRKTLMDQQANLLGGSDLFRTVQLLPGIAAHDDSSTDIKIRGSNADATMLLLDHMPIYNADHYYGVFSSIQSNYIEKISLYKNVFPICYSGATAGLLKMDSGGPSKNINGVLDLNLLNAGIVVNTPINKTFSLNIGARSTLKDVNSFSLLETRTQEARKFSDTQNTSVKQVDLQKSDPNFRFYDMNAKLQTRLGSNAQLDFNFFHSKDQYLNTFQNSFDAKLPNVDYQEAYRFEENWSNLALGSFLNWEFNDTWKLEASTHFSKSKDRSDLNSSLVRSATNDVEIRDIDQQQENLIEDIGGNIMFKRTAQHQLLFGLSANHFNTSVSFSRDSLLIRESQSEAGKLTLFASHIWKWKKWHLELGSRLTGYRNKNYKDVFASPKLLATYFINEQHAMKASLGRNHQFLRQLEYENPLGQYIEFYDLANNNQVSVGISDNYMLGYQFKHSNWMFDVELFYKDMNGILELTNISPGPIDVSNQPNYRLFSGDGVAFGVDFLVNYQTKKYHSWLAYTLSKSYNQIDELFRNKPYPNQDDRRHQLKWMNTFKFGKLSTTLNFIYASGKPYLSFNDLLEVRNRADLEAAMVYKYLPFYGRVDIGLSYGFQFLKRKASIGASVFNLTNRSNVKFIQQSYSVDLPGQNQNTISTILGNESQLLPRTLDLQFRWYF